MADFVTIKQFADARGISTTAVYKRLQTSYKEFLTVQNGQKCFDASIFEKFPPVAGGSGVSNGVSNDDNPIWERLIEALQDENAMLRGQIEAKDRQIEALSSALASAQQSIQAEQALRASSIKRLPWWKKRKESE